MALSLLFGFLLGSIPFGLVITKAAGLGDIRNIGSGNIGATNVLRTGRRGLAAATLLLDVLKGTATVLLVRYTVDLQTAELAGLAAILGHTLTPWLRFKGGKGVATGLGVLLGISWPLGLATAAIWIAVFAATRISSAGALAACLAAPFIAIAIDPYPWPVPLIAGWIAYRHQANIARLCAGTEPKFGRK